MTMGSDLFGLWGNDGLLTGSTGSAPAGAPKGYHYVLDRATGQWKLVRNRRRVKRIVFSETTWRAMNSIIHLARGRRYSRFPLRRFRRR